MSKQAAVWSVYLVECADGSFYTGIAIDVVARVDQHNRGLGAKYTRGRRPVELVYTTQAGDRGEALKLEYALKQLTREQKQHLIVSAAPN